MAVSLALTAIQYLLRPKQQKGDVFDSKTYHTDGMQNSVEIGTPINVPYGVHKIAPQIRSYLSIAKGDDTTIEALCSCGEGVINGIRDVRLNNQSFGSLFGYKYHTNGKIKNGYWVTFGEKIQKVYESCKSVEYELVHNISPGFNVTITVELDWSKRTKFQQASADEPGYLIVYDWDGGTAASGSDADTIEIVQYTGWQQESGTGYLQFTGCRVTKSHTGSFASVIQKYKIKKNSAGSVYETIPGFSKTVVNHQEVNTNVTKSSPVTVTTQNKVEALAVTIGFPEGLYKFNEKKGYEKASVQVAVKWWPDGESWSGVETPVTTTRTQTSTNNHYIKLEKKKNYGYLVDSNGDYVEGTESELDQNTDWDSIEAKDILKFTLGGTNYECKVTKPPVKVPTGSYKYETVEGELQYNPVYRFKVNFKQQSPEQVDKYTGPKADKASYAFTYEETEYSNYYETTIEPDKAKLSDYRLTFILPEMEKFGNLDYKKYKVQVKKKTEDMTDSEKGINKMTFIELQEITLDRLAYPYEALLALKFTTNEKIYGTINNISCVVEGRILKDVQNTGNADRLSANYFDIFADVITNKRYGRGKELSLSSAELTDFYSKLSPEAAFADQTITENSIPRKRFEVNVNVDFKKPTINLIQALSICARSNIYWDGAKPLAYVDRATTPTALFGRANIIPGSYQDQTMDLTEDINRIYPQFLNKNKNYTHDSVARDLRDEGFTINKLRPKNIALYGITDRWRVTKIANYLLRFAKYVQRGCQFQTGGDGITVDIGKTFYYINTKGNCGRILAVASNNITLDKAFTLESGKTYKALLRKDDGAPHTELTVDVGTTGLGGKTVIYFTQSISGVTLATNPIYGIGVAGEYYDTYRCVTKNTKSSSYEISGALYNAETYRLYRNDPSSDPSTNDDTDETEASPTTLENKSMFPPNIISLKAVEDKNAMGTVSVYVTRPISTVWTHAEVYISGEDDNIEQNVGRTTGDPLRITGLKPDVEYTIKAVSYANTTTNPTPFETTLTLEGTEPGRVSGLEIINNRGNETEMFGRDFKVRCNDMSGIKSDDLVRKSYESEGLRYLWKVYYSGLPDTVKLGSTKANTKEVYSELTRQNEFDFTLEENIEAAKKLWKSYKNDANADYDTYYGNPQREITIKCWLINAWGRMSPAPAEITLTNPAPDMKDENGAVMTPTLRKIKNGHRITFKHPHKEYDITDFVLVCSENSGFTQNVKRYIVTSVITVNSSDEDVGEATYKTEIDGLDKKKTYYYKVIPRDPFGKGTASNTASGVPGGNHDEDEVDIVKPATITGLALAAVNKINTDGKNVTNIKATWTKLTETDIDGHSLEWRATADTSAATAPTPEQVEDGVDGSGNFIDGDIKDIQIDGEASNRNWAVLKAVTHNLKYFCRVRGINTGGQRGIWSAWASIVITKATGNIDTTAPSLPSSVTATAEQTTIKIKIATTTADRDLAGYQISIKEGTTEGASVSFSSDHAANVKTSIAVTADNATATYNYTGKAGFNYIVAANAYDKSGNVNSGWTEASAQVLLEGLTSDGLSDPVSLAIYTGSFSADDADTVSWASGGKVKIRRTGGNTKEYTIGSGSTGNLAGTRYIVFNKATSTTAFSVVSTTGDSDVVVATVQPVSSGKANIRRHVGDQEGEYSISRYAGGFNQLSAITAELGKILMSSGGYVKIYLDSASSVIRIAKSGYNADTETNPDNLLWSSAFNNFKIIDQGVQSVTIASYNVNAGSYNAEVKVVKSSIGLSTARGVIGFASIGGGYGSYRRILPIQVGSGNSESALVSIAYSPNDDAIVCVSQAWNWGAGTQTVPELTFNLAWYLLGETLE